MQEGCVHLKRWAICCSQAVRMGSCRERAVTLPWHISSQRLRISSRNNSIHWLSSVHVLGCFSFLVFHERKGYLCLATYMEGIVVFWFCFINCGMLLIIFNPTSKLGVESSGLGIPRSSTDQFVIQLSCWKRKKPKSCFFLLELYEVIYCLRFGLA